MHRRPILVLVLVVALTLMISSAAVAADLPRWDDDSAATLTSFPRVFTPWRESVNLVAHIYHPIESLTDVAWRIEDIRQNDGAGLEYTLNTLDLKLPNGLAINALGDGYRMDKFFRFNQSLQRFFDLSARIETTFALPAPAAHQ